MPPCWKNLNILFGRQDRAGKGRRLAPVSEERVGEIPCIMEDGGKTGITTVAARVLPTGSARAARRTMAGSQELPAPLLEQVGRIGLLVAGGDGGVIPRSVPISSTLTTYDRHRACPHPVLMFPRKGRASPVPNTGMGVSLFSR